MLGNQLFQYAALRSLSEKTGVPVILPLPENHRLGDFNIAATYEDYETIASKVEYQYKEEKFHFEELFFLASPNTDFLGYFQSEKYFKDIKDIIKQEFTLKDKDKIKYSENYLEELRTKSGKKTIVALHNRRGNNVPVPVFWTSKKHGWSGPDIGNYVPLTSLEYFQTSMEYMRSKVGDCCFLVFSDNQKDVDWCKENIKGNDLYFSEGNDDLVDLEIMKTCDHNITSNSTYSWWAAWLNPNKDKVITIPKVWFGPAVTHSTKDLKPREWKEI